MYHEVRGSRGLAPKFEITWGLREGYGPTGSLHTVEEVIDYVGILLHMCAKEGKPFLTGSVTTGTLVYAWPAEDDNKAGFAHEPQATFSGNLNRLYHSELSRPTIEIFLNKLARAVAAPLGQTRVYVSYDGEMWILQREDSPTPTGT